MGFWAEQDVQEQQLPRRNLVCPGRGDDTNSATSTVPGLETFLPVPPVTEQAGIPRLAFPGAEQGTGSTHVLFPGALAPRVPGRRCCGSGRPG